MQPEKRLSQLEPPSPAPSQQPLQIMDLWEQYSDPSTGRSYYVNSITKEKSWKPPRRARGRTTNKVAHPSQPVFTVCYSSVINFFEMALNLKASFLKGEERKGFGWRGNESAHLYAHIV